ncbi:hypothetical protein SAMN04488550_0597 [Gordonia malaquae]|uniref:Uncharacterized protein n=1 Tax=Gordonia malaquae NBRC 108250 TaxID=1223542 RepID=M3UM34_GORML|nr:hypothetical protein [Gordonia malaquae]GAC80840.1 hypothetical protein GM1_022_00510 [Gordonia malaquae NBRC 108250]SEB67492.1 hypothetical protein SAMN04488550_0597 [Gordonia malaquae]
MSDNEEFEYVDEDGNPLSADEIAALGDEVEIVEETVEAPTAVPAQPAAEAPTPAAPATQGRKVPKAALAGVAAVVVLIGGGAVWGLHTLGNQNTAADVKAAVSSKTEAVKSSVAVKSSEVLGPPEEEKSDRTGTRVTGATCMDPAPAVWDGEGDPPEHRLRRESAADLPSSVTARVKRRHKDDPSEISMVQPEKGRLDIYASGAVGNYNRAEISIAGGVPVVLGDGGVLRVGRDVGICPTTSRITRFAVVSGNREKSIEILSSKAVGDTMYGITDDEVIELSLEKVDPPSDSSAASSPAPSK